MVASRRVPLLLTFAAGAGGLKVDDLKPIHNFENSLRQKLPLKVFSGQECLDNIQEDVPVVALLGNKGTDFARLPTATFLQELLSDMPQLQLCEAGTWKASTFAPALMEKAASQKVGFIINSKTLGFDLLQQVESISVKKPDLLIQIGDEDGMMYPLKWYPKLLNENGLVVRQYSHGYEMPEVPRTLVAPVGYDRMVQSGTHSCESIEKSTRQHRSSDRKYQWAFLRTDEHISKDEVEMMLHLIEGRTEPIPIEPSKAMGQLTLAMHKVSNSNKYLMDLSQDWQVADTFLQLKQAAFAPISPVKGNLESSKLYEAVLAGTIPVIVASSAEINMAFKFHQDPPFIIAPSWKEAQAKMLALLGSPDELNRLQERLSLWWCGWTASLRHEIAQQLRHEAPTSKPAAVLEGEQPESLEEAIIEDQ